MAKKKKEDEVGCVGWILGIISLIIVACMIEWTTKNLCILGIIVVLFIVFMFVKIMYASFVDVFNRYPTPPKNKLPYKPSPETEMKKACTCAKHN